MKFKNSLLTESLNSCCWISFGHALTLALILLTAANEEYASYYSSVFVQVVNCFILYIGISFDNHRWWLVVFSIIFRVILVFLFIACVAYFVLAASTLNGTHAKQLFEFLTSPTVVYSIGGILSFPFGESIFELCLHGIQKIKKLLNLELKA